MLRNYLTIALRMKEIGIRKVLGASTQQIVNLLSKDFLLLVAALAAFVTIGFQAVKAALTNPVQHLRTE